MEASQGKARRIPPAPDSKRRCRWVAEDDEINMEEAVLTGFSEQQLLAIKRSVDSWPLDKSVKRASEELMELALSLLHFERGKSCVGEVRAEMADVKIALRHLEFKFGCYQAELDKKVIKGNGS